MGFPPVKQHNMAEIFPLLVLDPALTMRDSVCIDQNSLQQLIRVPNRDKGCNIREYIAEYGSTRTNAEWRLLKERSDEFADILIRISPKATIPHQAYGEYKKLSQIFFGVSYNYSGVPRSILRTQSKAIDSLLVNGNKISYQDNKKQFDIIMKSHPYLKPAPASLLAASIGNAIKGDMVSVVALSGGLSQAAQEWTETWGKQMFVTRYLSIYSEKNSPVFKPKNINSNFP